ncbi:MAG TPA: hypothetical protein VGA49_02870, partial [Patescibacteria group bacterium]
SGPEGNQDKIITVSRERYARARETVEDKIKRWSGMIVEQSDLKKEFKKPEEQKPDKPWLDKKKNNKKKRSPVFFRTSAPVKSSKEKHQDKITPPPISQAQPVPKEVAPPISLKEALERTKNFSKDKQ